MTNTQRVNIGKQHPAAYKALITMSAEVEENAAAAGLDPLLVELLKIRASQLNGCAFCLRMHTRDALKKGENPDRIAVLPGWEETGYFSETERAALRLTEAITRVSDGHVSDEDYDASVAALTADQVSAVAWLATVMNAFNRVAITSRYRVAPVFGEITSRTPTGPGPTGPTKRGGRHGQQRAGTSDPPSLLRAPWRLRAPRRRRAGAGGSPACCVASASVVIE